MDTGLVTEGQQRQRKRVIEKERIKLKLNYLGQRERKRESVCD